jgi:hypothetical protein
MIKKLYNWIENNYFEILLCCSIIIILILAIFRINKRGSWSDSYYYESSKQSHKLLDSKSLQTSKGELRCKQYLENYFSEKGYKFPKSRPDFMVNRVTGDKYNLELDLAVEYNGEQHYKYIPFFHKNKEAFYNQKYRDEIKRIRCRDLGIILIEVPYTELYNIDNYLKRELNNYGF